MARLASSGITRGCGDGTVFCPGLDTTRGQMATFLARATGVVPIPAAPTTSLWVRINSLSPSAVTAAFDVTIVFTAAVADFTIDDIRVSNGQATGFSGSRRTYAATIEPAADGTVVVRVPADSARDGSDRGNQASAPLTRVRSPQGGVSEQGIDTWDRAAVYRAYVREFRRTEPDWEYTGDVDSCNAGATGQQFRDSVFQRVNWFRQMAGLGTVEEDEDTSAGAQHTALMMLAEGTLSHQPGSSWACYSEPGRSYAESNLGLGVAGVAGIDGYMQDPGDNNADVGHRRWILFPQTRQMGTGNARGEGTVANALWPRDANTFSPRPQVREQRGFVAWPPSGFVPPQAAWGRWSFSLAGANFSAASVTMSDDSGPVRTEVIHRSQAPAPALRRAPEGAIVWSVAGDTDSDPMPPPSGADHCYTVKITGVRTNGATRRAYEYSTCLLGKLSRPQPSDHQQPDETAPVGDSDNLPEPGLEQQTQYQYKMASAGGSHSCAVRADGTIACWGRNDVGQADPPEGRFKAVSAGGWHSCAVRADDTVACWGTNWGGIKVGQADPPEGRFKAVSAGGSHSCAVRADDTIACWGTNWNGQAQPPDGHYKAVSAGTSHSCAVRADDTIACWGTNSVGEADAPEGRYKTVSAGNGDSCAVRADNTIKCWGQIAWG